LQSTHAWKWPGVKYKKPRICILFILCLAWTVNANSLKQNVIVIREIGSCHIGWMNRRFCLQTQQRQRPDPQRLFASLDVEQICFQKTLLYIDIFWKDPSIQIFQSVILTVTIESRSCQALIADICTVAKS